MVSDRTRGIVALAIAAIVAIVALGASVFFFLESVGLMARDTPYVTASILSALVGVALLSAATTVTRSLLLARVAERIDPEKLIALEERGGKGRRGSKES